MDKSMGAAITGILLALVGVAILSVILSKNANTTSVIGALGSGFSGSLSCALSPIIGGGNCGTTSSSTITFG